MEKSAVFPGSYGWIGGNTTRAATADRVKINMRTWAVLAL